MKLYTLARWVVFGKGDSSDPVEFDIAVTDEQYELLSRCEEEGVDFYDLPDEALRIGTCIIAEEMSKSELRESMDPDDQENIEYYDYRVGFWDPNWN